MPDNRSHPGSTDGPASRRRALLLAVGVALLVGAHAVANTVWLHQDVTLRAMDMGCHLAAVGELAGLLAQQPSRLIEAATADGPAAWPTAGYLPWVAPALLWDPSAHTLRLANLGWLALLLGSVAWIGSQLARPITYKYLKTKAFPGNSADNRGMSGVETGLLAAALLSLYPAVYGMSRQFGTDLPGTAVSALAVGLLLRTDRFHRTWPSLAFGATLGWLMLTRPLATLLLVAPALCALGAGLLRPSRRARPTIMARAAAAALVGAAVSTPWWFGQLGPLVTDFTGHSAGDFGDRTSPLFYLGVVPRAASPLLVLAAAPAVAALAGRARRRRSRPGSGELFGPALLGFWLVAGLVVQSLIQHRFHRYLFPVLPALALLTALGLVRIPRRWPRRIITAAVLCAASASWLLCSFNWGRPMLTSAERPQSTPLCTACGYWEFSGPPTRDPYVEAIGRATAAVARAHPGGRFVAIRLVAGRSEPQPVGEPPPPDRGPTLPSAHAGVVTKALVRTDLPHARLFGLRWAQVGSPEGGDDQVRTAIAGGVGFSRPWASRHCYTLALDPPDLHRPPPVGPTDTSPQPRKRVDRLALSWAGELRVTLWDHGACSLPDDPAP